MFWLRAETLQLRCFGEQTFTRDVKKEGKEGTEGNTDTEAQRTCGRTPRKFNRSRSSLKDHHLSAACTRPPQTSSSDVHLRRPPQTGQEERTQQQEMRSSDYKQQLPSDGFQQGSADPPVGHGDHTPPQVVLMSSCWDQQWI